MSRRNRRAIALSILTVVQTLAFMVSYTAAWFSNNQRVQSTGATVVATTSDMFDVSYRVFTYEKEYRRGIELPNDEEHNPSETSYDDRLELNRYDSVILSNNENINKIIRLELTPKEGKVIPTGTTMNLRIASTGAGQYHNEEQHRDMIAEYVSNVVGFKIIGKHQMTEIDDTDPDSIFTRVTAETENITQTTFAHYTTVSVTPEDGGEPYNEYYFDYKIRDIVFENLTLDPSGTSVFYLTYDYCVPLINAYILEDDDRVVTADNLEGIETEFDHDISYISFTHHVGD